MGCIIVSGTTAAADETAMKYPYAGVGFDFSNAKKPCVYNGSAYTGVLGLVQSGYDGGDWNGGGLVTSMSSVAPTPLRTP